MICFMVLLCTALIVWLYHMGTIFDARRANVTGCLTRPVVVVVVDDE
jgi:hypothetical protein